MKSTFTKFRPKNKLKLTSIWSLFGPNVDAKKIPSQKVMLVFLEMAEKGPARLKNYLYDKMCRFRVNIC